MSPPRAIAPEAAAPQFPSTGREWLHNRSAASLRHSLSWPRRAKRARSKVGKERGSRENDGGGTILSQGLHLSEYDGKIAARSGSHKPGRKNFTLPLMGSISKVAKLAGGRASPSP